MAAIAYAMVLNNRRLLKRAAIALLTGASLTVLISMAIASMISLKSIPPEILSRANPSLIDLGVAMAAGTYDKGCRMPYLELRSQ